LISPGVDFEVKEGVPIVIGMSVICLGKGCLEYIKSFLDSIDLSRELIEDDGSLVPDRTMTARKNIEMIYKAVDILNESFDINEISSNILNCLFDLLTSLSLSIRQKLDKCSDLEAREL